LTHFTIARGNLALRASLSAVLFALRRCHLFLDLRVCLSGFSDCARRVSAGSSGRRHQSSSSSSSSLLPPSIHSPPRHSDFAGCCRCRLPAHQHAIKLTRNTYSVVTAFRLQHVCITYHIFYRPRMLAGKVLQSVVFFRCPSVSLSVSFHSSF